MVIPKEVSAPALPLAVVPGSPSKTEAQGESLGSILGKAKKEKKKEEVTEAITPSCARAPPQHRVLSGATRAFSFHIEGRKERALQRRVLDGLL